MWMLIYGTLEQVDTSIVFLILFAEAYNILLEAEKKDIILQSLGYSTLIKALLGEGCLEKAIKVKDM